MHHDIDDFLIDTKFQPFAHWFQKLTGLTNFWLAKWCIFFYGTSYVLERVINEAYFDSGFVGMMLIPLISIVFFITLDLDDKKWKNGGFMNENRIDTFWFFSRILFLYICAFELVTGVVNVNFLFYLPEMFYTATLYFFTCTPIPPSKSKIRKLYEKVLIKIDEKLSEKPEPVPVKN